MKALGLIETVGYSTAVFAADAGLKAAEVQLRGIERVIGVAGSLGVSVEFEGEVAAVQSAISAAKEAGERVGRVLSVLVIPRVHDEVSQRILPLFSLDVGHPSKQADSHVVDTVEEKPMTEIEPKVGEQDQTTNKRRTKHE